MSLIKKFATVASGTMMSRIFGFIRETLMAAAVGTGTVADAFNAAFRFPNTFRRLFAEGAFNAAFVPLFARQIEEEGKEGATKFATEVFGVLFSVLLLLTIAMELAMPFLVAAIIAPGFTSDAEKYQATVRLATIMFPYLTCMSLAAMMGGMLNALHRYFAAAIAPVFLNVILIGVLIWAWFSKLDVWHIGLALSWSVMAAGLVQLIIVWGALRRAGMKISLRLPHFTANVRRLLILALPAAITGGITQINLLINTAIASGQAGAVSSLAYADRLYQLPLGVIGIAVGTVLLPELARALRAKKHQDAARLQNQSVKFTLLLTLPAAAAFLVISQPIVQLLFERGQFNAQSTVTVAGILAVYGLGLPAFVLIKAFIPGFFAREDTRTPMIFAAFSVVTNITLALTLFPYLHVIGIAIAEITAGWVNAVLLFATLILRGHWRRGQQLRKSAASFIFSAFVMGLAIWFAKGWLAAQLDPAAPFMVRALALVLLVISAAAVYFSMVFLTGGASLAAIRQNFRRKTKS
ncbi:MAG: MurJ-like protein [Candidatus Tokpelaia hoelldobleri]|uniref:Probable lipid II flippase MurJ n=1 Tax=Candidatus Tokpelaia hoelldobleri TaxID=1902579 RepID=A0A1U9JTJ1_9HYPH|nr:MAG: MurJ-like protein [Candidatus Tokpelaia hoelldoblerii]